MTGASRGIGRIAAEKILNSRPELHLVLMVRGAGGHELVAELARATGNANVSAIPCDLASLASIRAAAGEVVESLQSGALPPLRGFVGNAGLQMVSRTHVSADGIELTFAVNVLANYLLVRLLWDQFTAPARIVLTGSDTHFGDRRHNRVIPAPHWEDPRLLAAPRYDDAARTTAVGRTAYSTSKLAVIYLVHELARRLPTGTDVYTFAPGFVPDTGLLRDAGPVARLLSRTVLRGLALTPLAHSPSAAGTWLARAAGGSRPGESGTYISRSTRVDSSAESFDRDRENELWRTAAELCGLPAEHDRTGRH
ncbi:NAD(P)-dependent dehydrogenase, short-chain alcohol dehydrogenase family [Sinosporangium album]|uniref:NAD(P)-dependent dehydrogenase, short-chain alcohol dehydrogenase family n=1 Tax=Sinosporangium album TaxID=504805 RepID=A0A1G7S7Q5_9ACTN|nr:SDR family NAD(P)-dependent oxidoreductase [Sinosporangium album]SDG19013.1 NAD(P)-dependent dehydrogenase, short-chain alcohol dehydrogenase family [Sinosporangium album]